MFIWCLLDADTSAAYGLRERVFERFCGCSFDRLQGMGIQVTGDTDGRMPKVRGYSLDASPFGNQQSSIRVPKLVEAENGRRSWNRQMRIWYINDDKKAVEISPQPFLYLALILIAVNLSARYSIC